MSGASRKRCRSFRPLLRGEKVTFDSEFYTTREAENIPKGPRAAGPPIMIGVLGRGPRMKRLVAQHADQWNCWLASGDSHAGAYVEHRDAMLAGCEKHGRDPATLGLNVTVRVCPPGGKPVSEDMKPLSGPPAQIAEQLLAFEALGVDHITVWPHPNTSESLEVLGDVLQALR